MKKVICIVLCFSFIFCRTLIAFAEDENNALQAIAGVYADGYCLIDANTLEVIASNDQGQRLPIASTTKIMSAIVAIENSKLDDVVTVSKDAVGVEGSSLYLYAGEKLTMHELLFGLMLESANDAATAIAIHVAGSVDDFAVLMNEKVKELGLQNTNFKNPHGLQDDDHYSSAYDLAVILSYGLKNEVFKSLIATKNYKIPLNKEEGYRYLTNHNRLLSSYEYCIGGKTGFTKRAGRCLATAAQKGSTILVSVTLNAADDWNAHKALFNYGFSLYSEKALCVSGEYSYEVPVVGGVKDSVTVTNLDGLTKSVKNNGEITSTVELERFAYAPLKLGEGGKTSLGRVVFKQNGKVIGEVALYTQKSVDWYEPPTFWDKIKSMFD